MTITEPKRRRLKLFVPLMMAFLSLASLTNSGRLEYIRMVDVLALLGSGMCIGVALTSFFHLVRHKD